MSRHHGTVRTNSPSTRPMFEALEDRCLMHGAALDVVGTNRANVIAVTLNQGTGMIEVRVDGANPFPDNPGGFDPADLEAIHIRGLRGHDTIAVDAAIQVPTEIFGDAGNDTITGGGGPDTIDGGAGRDSIDGGPGDDSLIGGTSHDALAGGTENDNLSGDAGNDQLNGGDGDDMLRTGRGRDSVTGGAGADMFGPLTRGSQRVDFNPAEDLEITQVVMPDFSLPDLNPNSATFNQNVGPSVFRGSVSAYYFTHAG